MRRLTLQDNLASYLNIQLKTSNTSYCERTPEHNHCWPEVDPDILIELPCPNEPIHHHRYMTKYCNTTGHWEPANYTQCFNCDKRTNFKSSYMPIYDKFLVLTEYVLGFSSGFSVVACLIGIWIYRKFKILQCMRVKVHEQLFLSLI